MLLVLIFASVYVLPIAIAKLRSKSLGLNIDFNQAKLLAKNKCLTKDFLFKVKEIWAVHPTQLDILIHHYFAGGDLNNLKIGILEMTKRKKEPNIKMLTTLELAKRDLKSEVEKAERNNWRFEY